MEKIELRKSVLAFLQVLALSFLCGVIAVTGFAFGDLQAVLYSALLMMCGLFIIALFVDNFDSKMEE